MKNIKFLRMLAFLALAGVVFSCGDDDEDDDMMPMLMPPTANAGINQTVDLEKSVTLNASGSTGEGTLTYQWTVTGPGGAVTLDDATAVMPSFRASAAGTYTANVTVTNADGDDTASTTVNVENPTYATADQMGRPGINTVFNFFADSQVKNDFNLTTPEGGTAPVALFEGTIDLLQEYIGLDSDTYTNILGLDNTTTATVLSTDVLTSNLDFPSSYGPSDLNNIVAFQNVLNGRRLSDDIIDVTLILIFAGNDLGALNDTQLGLISDNISVNDADFATTFPYLAAPN